MKNKITMIKYRINDLQLNTFGCRSEIQYKNCEGVCYTIAYWNGNNLTFVGAKPFNKEINKKDFWKLAKRGQKKLDD